MRIEPFGKAQRKRAGRGPPLSSKDGSAKEHGQAELLRSRIEELDRRLAILNSDPASLVLQLGGRRSKQYDA